MTDPNGNGNGAPPVANRPVVQGELRRALRSRHRNPGSSVLLLRAAPEWRDDTDFGADLGDGTQVPVTVAPCPTVLTVLAALAADREPGRYLVVLTPRETGEMGESVLARAMQPEIKPVNRWDLVQDAFGARRLDPVLTTKGNRWIAEGLLDAQPAGGWRRLTGTVLTRTIALNRLAAARLGMDAVADDSGVDAAALLDWTTDPAAVASFLALRVTEREGLIKWLRDETAKPVADVVFGMAETGKITDAVPFGLVVAALYGRQDTIPARIRAEERYLAGCPPEEGDAAMRTFGEAAESLVTRWIDNENAPQAARMCERAEAILTELGGSAAAGESRVLEAGLDARFASLAEAISAALPEPSPAALARAEKALSLVREHGRRKDHEPELRAAQDAVRLVRWLAVPEEPPATVPDGATRTLRSWAWADRALAAVSRADTSRVPRLERAYGRLWEQARQRRARLDEAFAGKLAAWADGPAAEGGLLLARDIPERIVRPVARHRLPVVVAVEGLTAAVACELAEGITTGDRWLEVGRREDGREPALAAGDAPPVAEAVVTTTGDLGRVLDEARRASRPVILTADRPEETVVPVITLLPSGSPIPPAWYAYDADGHAPLWWTAPLRDHRPPAPAPKASAPKPSRKRRTAPPEPDGNALFSVGEAASPSVADVPAKDPPTVPSGSSLGARVVASPQLASQRRFVRRAPDDTSVAMLIDALVAAGGRLTRAEVADAVGEPSVRMSGYLALVTRLLNVEGYPVLQGKDDGRTTELNSELLRQQFLSG